MKRARLLVGLVLSACGGGSTQTPDDAASRPDAPIRIDAGGGDIDAGGGGTVDAAPADSSPVTDAAPFTVSLIGTDPESPSNDATPDVLGVAGSGCVTVEILEDGTTLLASDPAGTGLFRIATPVNANASTTLVARCLDGSGGSSPLSDPITYVHDDVAPPAPAITGTIPASPSSTLSPEVNGTAGGDCGTVEVWDQTALLETTTPAAGVWAVIVTVAADATTALRARCVDAAGNTSGYSPSVDYTHSSGLPGPPTLTSTMPTSPSTDATPTVIGVAPLTMCAAVEIWDDMGGSIGEGTPDASGDFSITVTVTSNATTLLRGRCRTSGGVLSDFSPALAYTHDDIAPAIPTLTGFTPASPSNDSTPDAYGTYSSTDCTTAIVYNNATGLSIGEGATNGDGTYSVSITVPLNATTLIAVRCRDGAGNTSGLSLQQSYTHDNVAPLTPTITGTNPASPSADQTPLVNGNRGATNGDCTTVEIWNGMIEMLAEGTTSTTFSIETTVLSNASTPLRARCRDAAGNTSGYSSTVTYVHDDTAPSPPTIDSITPASPSSDYTPTVAGTAIDPTCTAVEVWVNGAYADETTPFMTSWTIDVFVMMNSTSIIKARCRDSGGNVSSFTADETFVHDNTPPPLAPTITGSNPTSPSNVDSPEVYGSIASPDCAHIDIRFGTGMVIATADRTMDGSWAAFVTVPTNTTQAINARCRDLAGNTTGFGASLSYTHDNVPPPTPTTPTTTPASPSNNDTPNVNSTTSTTGCGTAQVYSGMTFLASSAVGPTVTSFSVATTVTSNGTTSLRIRCRDAAGNTSPFSSSISYTHDDIAPAAPTITGTNPTSPSMTGMVTVSGEGGGADCPTVELWNSVSVDYGDAATGGSSSWSMSVVVPAGTTNFRARCRDAAGNLSLFSADFAYEYDITPPTGQPQITGFSPSSGAALPTVSGTQPSDCVFLQVWRDAATPVLHASGDTSGTTWSLDFTTSAAVGTHNYKARCRDAAGNYTGYGLLVSYTR